MHIGLIMCNLMTSLPPNLDIYLLGFLLNLPSSVLDLIDQNNIEKSCRDLFEYLSSNTELTWTDITDKLVEMGELDLLRTLKTNERILLSRKGMYAFKVFLHVSHDCYIFCKVLSFLLLAYVTITLLGIH